MKIALQTAAKDPVWRGDIPAFNPQPTVILWGDRVFTFEHFAGGTEERTARPGEPLPEIEQHAVYTEVFAYALVESVEAVPGHGFGLVGKDKSNAGGQQDLGEAARRRMLDTTGTQGRTRPSWWPG